MKIAFIGQKGIPAKGGGIEKYAQDLSVHLAKAGHEVLVYARPHYTDPKLEIYHGVRLLNLRSIRTKHLDTISHSLFASIDAIFRRPDIIHYQNIGPALVSWIPKIFSPGSTIIATLQSRDYEHKKWGAFARLALRIGEYFLCKFSDQVVVITKEMEKYARETYKIKNIRLIPNGTDFLPPLPAQNIKKWGLEKGSYITAISRLVGHKGLAYLIEAHKTLDTDKKLVIVGAGAFTDDYVRELKEMAAGRNDIIFTGNQTGQTLEELYANAALFVQPSESEGLSLALLEAMSYDLPILVSDIPENLEAVGPAGYVFKSKNVTDLKKKIEYILSHPQEAAEKGREAGQRAREHYSWDKIAQDMAELYAQSRRK